MKSLIIQKLSRSGASAPTDELTFTKGVNVIAGRPNTGKTKWLQMLDYTFGNDGTPQDAFGDDLAEKFDSFKAVIEIDGESMIIERRWKEAGNKGKIFYDGEPLLPKDFWGKLLTKLNIPLLHYPQGSPFGPAPGPN